MTPLERTAPSKVLSASASPIAARPRAPHKQKAPGKDSEGLRRYPSCATKLGVSMTEHSDESRREIVRRLEDEEQALNAQQTQLDRKRAEIKSRRFRAQ